MRWLGNRRPAAFIPRQLPRRRTERRDVNSRASWIGNERATVPLSTSRAVADPQLERVELAPRPERTVTTLPERRAPDRGPNCKTKRQLDIALALIGLVVLLPLLLLIAAAVMIDSPGPVFFRQWRGGYYGRRFRILKFRTMTCMEDGRDVRQARVRDARITRAGRVLRKTSLDELPQLFNVLRGDMSLVGPRPHALVHDEIYSALIRGYSDRQLVKPGVTGWAQINGCRGETRELAAMERRIKRDLEYIRCWSLQLDFIIMIKTVKELLRPHDAY
jgi:putative colanic acid biosynthesis UDP-glucose lipid carrier transferase